METQTYIGSRVMQRHPLRNRRKREQNYDDGVEGGVNHNGEIKQVPSPTEKPQRRTQRICQPMPDAATRQSSITKSGTVKICNRVFTVDPENSVTWDEVLSARSKSKSLPSPPSSSLADPNTAAAADTVMAATTQEPVHQTSAGILEVPRNATASANNTARYGNSNNSANGNRNKDDDDNNCRSRHQQQQQRITEAVAQPPVMPAASVREFMTFERLRLGDQINFLLFDPYRTLKFLITELKSRLRTVVPDDINVQKILVEIQQTMKRIRIPNATEPLVPPPPRTSRTTTGPAGMPAEVECILPKERCHVIKEDPLINHARKVNSSCQTIEPQLENVNACQMCEHCAAGCNQKRMNGNINAQDCTKEVDANQRSEDHRKYMETHYCYKPLQDAIENLKIKSNPFSDDTQKIITQLETELSNFQHELQRTSFSHQKPPPPPPPLGIKSTTENLKVQCKRLMNEEGEKAQQQEEETFLDFIANLQPTPSMHDSKKLDSSTQVAAATTVSKESQTNLKRSTQMFCQLEKEKLLLLQQFRASEMQTIQGDLNELHVFIKDQLDGIYHSITRENLNLKYHSNYDQKVYKSKKKIQRTVQGPEKTTNIRPLLPSSSSTPSSLTALTSSVLSSTEMQREMGVNSTGSSVSPGHYKKSSSPATNDGNANNTKSMMKQKQQQQQQQLQKSSSSSLSAAADAKESHNISDVDKENKTLGEKKSKGQHSYHCNQHHLFAHINCCAPVFADTPFCSAGKKIHFSAVECEGCCCPHAGMDDKVHSMMTTDAARTSTHNDIKSTKKTSQPAVTTCHQHRQQCHQQSTTMAISAIQEPTQLISSSSPVPPYITKQSAADQRAPNLTNLAVRSIIENAYETTAAAATATSAKLSNGIRMHKPKRQSYQAHNSWQRVNLKNTTGCQLKKICGDGYECRINNNNNNNGNRSNYSEIHDCQKCLANSINPFGGLCSAEMHEVGADNAAAASTVVAATAAAVSDDDDDGGDRDDGRAGGDGPIYCDEANGASAVLEDFTCHTGQRKQARKLQHNFAAKAAFQTDLEEFKAFLDEIIPSTPRLK